MSFLTLFLCSCLFYIVNANPTKNLSKIKECACDDKLDKFHNDLIVLLYSKRLNPVEMNEPIEHFKDEVLEVVQQSGMDSDIFEKELDLTLNQIEAKASSKTGLTKMDLKNELDSFIVTIIRLSNSPEYKIKGCKKNLNIFTIDARNVLINAGLNPTNFIGVLDKFRVDMLEVVGSGEFDPWLLKQELDDQLEDLTKSATSILATPDLLATKLGGCISNVKEMVADPDYTKANMEKYKNYLLSELYLAVDKMTPMMNELKLDSDKQEYLIAVLKKALQGYVNYLQSQMLDEDYKQKHGMKTEEDNDIYVSFPKTEEE